MLENPLSQRYLLQKLLQQLQDELQQKKLWQIERPSEAALNSRAPFAIDTLTFAQWVQFIFIEKLRGLLQANLPLPQSMSVQPMAEEYFKNLSVDSGQIMHIIGEIDRLINKGEQ